MQSPDDSNLPHYLVSNDFIEIKMRYNDILHLMPKDFIQTLNVLQQDITVDEIAFILKSDDHDVANRKILNCLIQKMKNREQMLDFCGQLEKLITSQDLKTIVDEIRTGVQQGFQFSNYSETTHAQSVATTLSHEKFFQAPQSQKPATKKYTAFIVYLINKSDHNRRQILILSDILCCYGIDCNIDQYHSTKDIISWPQWVSQQIDKCIAEGGYILLECSQVMCNILGNPDNPPIKMVAGHIDCQTIRCYLHHKTKNFLPFFIDEVSSDLIPSSLSERTPYCFPFSKLPKVFTSDSYPNFTKEDAEQLIVNPDFTSLRSLVAMVTKQQEICQPNIGSLVPIQEKQNLINKTNIYCEQQYDSQSLMQKIFNVIIECLPSNCYHSVCKIKENKQFADVNDEIDDVLINCEKNDVVTEQLLWYMYKKCDYDFLKLKGILENIFPRHSLLTSANINSQLNRDLWPVFCTDESLPNKLTTKQGFTELKQCYHLLIQWMPMNYRLTIEHFKDYLSDDQIATILNSSNFHNANRKIMNFLIERITYKEELIELCDQLHQLYTSCFMKLIVNELKTEIQDNELLSASKDANNTKVIPSKDELLSSASAPICAFLNCNYFQHLPKLPPYYVDRKLPLERMVNILCHTNPNGNILLVTGAGGYGKTTLIIALCNHKSIRDNFSNHILVIPLGPQANHPITKLKKLYFDLTGMSVENATISDMKLQFKNIIKSCSHNILIVIDDVWHLEDAEPILSTFDSCHVVLSSRMTDISQLVKSAKSVNVQEMHLHEAIDLLSYNLSDFRLKEDEKALTELAKDAHLWPLLLFLIRGQLRHYIQYYDMSFHNAIKNVKHHLDYRGLTAFDKQYSGVNRNHSAKICIEMTLKLLSEEDIRRFKSLILFTGIGGLFPKLALHSLWNISKDETEKITDTLCTHGLLSHKCIVLPAYCKNNRYQDCVVTHTVISKYIVDSVMTDEVADLSPHIQLDHPILNELKCLFKICYGADDISLLTPKDYLTYTQHLIEHVMIPYYLKMITMHALHDPHLMLIMLQKLQTIINSSGNENQILIQFSEKIVKLNSECNKILRNSHNSNRLLNKEIEQQFMDKQYEAITQTLEEYYKVANIGFVASRCIELVKEILPHAKSQLKEDFESLNRMLLMKTPAYHSVRMEKLPLIKKYISLHKEISTTLEVRTDEIWKLYTSLASKHTFEKELETIIENYRSKLKIIAPNIEIGTESTNARIR